MTPPHAATVAGTARPRQVRPFLLAAVLTALLPAVVAGQAAEGPKKASSAGPMTPAEAAGSGTNENESPPFGLVKPEDGTLVPLPPGTSYADFLEWLSARRGPGYGINSVKISGEVGDGPQIELDAEVEVVVRHDEAVLVPLGFTEAVLVGVEHEGVGDESYQPFSKESGHAWFLQGRGEHRLTLKLLVSLSSRGDETRLALTTPQDAATTTVNLVAPTDSEVTAADGIVRSTTATETGVAVEWVGTGGLVDLTWRPKPVVAAPEDLSVSTTIFPTVSGKNVQIRAVQRVTATEGKISTVRLRLPDGFTLTDVTGRLVKSSSEEMTPEGRFVTVELIEPTEGTVELTVRVGAPLPTDGKITVAGFSLLDAPADTQSGQIVIESSAAHSISVADRSDGVDRMEMIAPDQLAAAQVYEFTSQPFRVDLQIEAIPPSLSVSPELIFQVTPDRLDLDAEFAVAVSKEKGELREMRLTWPGSGWTISRIGSGLIQEFRRGDGTGPPIEISVPAATPSFVVPVRANRPIEIGDEPIEVTLPRLEATAGGAVVEQEEIVLCFRHPKSLAVEVDETDGLRIDDPSRLASLPEPTPDEEWTVLVASSDLRTVDLRVRRLSREVDASTVVAVRPRGDDLLVEERIDYDIRYGTISELRIRIPKPLRAGAVSFVDSGGRSLVSEATDTSADDAAEVVLALGRAVRGPFSITARFEVPNPTAASVTADVAVPLVHPSDATLETAELQVSRFPSHAVSVAGPDWFRLQTTENNDRGRWVAAEVGEAIVLRLRPRPADEPKSHSIPNLLLRSVVDRSGIIRSVADCRFEQPPERIAVHFPKGVEPEWYRWRGRAIEPDLVADGDGRLAEFELTPGSGPPVLTVAFRTVGDSPLGFVAARRILTPRFGDDVAVGKTLWRVTLPDSHHLFSAPTRYVPRFSWGLRGGLWTRRTDEPFRDVGEWFGSEIAPFDAEFDTGHQYVFSRDGEAEPLAFTSLSRSLVVLLGAGAAIMIGYAFASGLLPWRRLALVAIGSVFLVLWAFFPNQIQVFFQPALFGVALVAVASFVERTLRKRQERLSTATPSGVEFVTILPGDGSTSAPPAAIGSEEPTVLRTGAHSEALSGSHAGSAQP